MKGLSAVCLGLLLASACGGASFSGNGNEGGSTGQGGASSQGGTTSKGGSISKAGSTSTGGSPDCTNVLCARIAAPAPFCEGELVIQPGECCPACSCENIDCAYPVCEDGAEPVVEPGRCCPACPPPQPGCAAVVCEAVTSCGPGYMLAKPPGACCQGCVPIPGAVACTEEACPIDDPCPLGYVRGDLLGGCCNDCLPDPLYCSSDADCLVADRPRSCCGCPEPISTRQYDQDPCWFAVDAPRPIPEECYPDAVCGALCGECPPPRAASCFQNRCSVLPK